MIAVIEANPHEYSGSPSGFGNRVEFSRASGTWFFEQDVFASLCRASCEWRQRVMGGGDNDKVDGGTHGDRVRVSGGLCPGIQASQILSAFSHLIAA
jgi:hypothetical protein